MSTSSRPTKHGRNGEQSLTTPRGTAFNLDVAKASRSVGDFDIRLPSKGFAQIPKWELRGVSLAQAGPSNLKATGEVFHLDRVQDVNGSYAAAAAGAAMVDGHSETTMKNDRGVVMKLHGKTDDIDLRLSVDGVWVKLTQ